MSKDIRIRKGLNINLVGAAEQTISKAVTSNVYALNLDDFHGITPKMLIKQGEDIKAGEPLFYNKNNEEMHFVSPVSGELVEIVRGARRRILTLKILADKEQDYVINKVPDLDTANGETIKSYLLQCGGWPFIKQRPYDVIADPGVTPKAIFISAYGTAPLAANPDFILKDKEQEIQAAILGLGKLTPGKIHVTVGKSNRSPFNDIEGVELHKISGPHPAGLVGTQINKIDPINKGETVWTISPQDLVMLGELLLTGKFNAERIVALAGSVIKEPKYYKTKIGAEISTFLYASGVKEL